MRAHSWAGSLSVPGVKEGVKRAEQMEEERETETEWADGEVLGKKELFSAERCEDITVQWKRNKKSARLKSLGAGEVKATLGNRLSNRAAETGGKKGWKSERATCQT